MIDPELKPAETAPEAAPVDTAHISEIAADPFAAERAQLEQEKRDLNDRLMRLAAEFDNFRKRSEREKAEIIEYASTEAVKSLLPILDDFERALKVETADAEYARGMGLIHTRLADSLKKLGLEPIVAEGEPFDPNLHYAIDRTESPDVEVDTVSCELQRGYLFKGRLLRASMVRVTVKA